MCYPMTCGGPEGGGGGGYYPEKLNCELLLSDEEDSFILAEFLISGSLVKSFFRSYPILSNSCSS